LGSGWDAGKKLGGGSNIRRGTPEMGDGGGEEKNTHLASQKKKKRSAEFLGYPRREAL